MTPGGVLTALYSFCTQQNCVDGKSPYAELLQGPDGNLCGTTASGGDSQNCSPNFQECGTIFKITPTGDLTRLYSFNYNDGAFPEAGLVKARDGNFYGTTGYGGAQGGWGTVFRLTPQGTLTTLYSFCSQGDCLDGLEPLGALAQGVDGEFYGTTYYGGVYNWGTVFKITSQGTLTTLHSFNYFDYFNDGASPYSGVVQGPDGNFYGTTELPFGGGDADYGRAFNITPEGVLTILHRFDYTNGS